MPESLNQSELALQLEAQAFAKAVSVHLEDEQLTDDQRHRKVRKLSLAHGLYGLNHPRDLGGRDATSLETVVVYDTLGSFNLLDVPGTFGPSPGVLGTVNEPLRSNYLKPMLEGKKRAAFGFTEPDDAERPTWAAVERDWLNVNGCKSYVTGGANADFINTLVDVDGFGPAMVVIDGDADGVNVEKVFGSIDGSHHAVMRFTDVRVPINHVVGELGRGLPTAMGQIGNTRLVFAAQSAGLARWVIQYVKDHIQAPHRSGTPLGSREGIRMRYADMRINAYAARSMVYRTARLFDSGENAINEVIASKVFATEMIHNVVDTAIQLVGGNALRQGHPLAELYHRVRAWRLAEGANDILRLNLSRGILDLKKGRI